MLVWKQKPSERKTPNRPLPPTSEGKETVESSDTQASEEWTFAPSGDGYFITGPGGRGHFSGLKGFGQILQVIRSQEAVPMLLLAGGADGARLGADRRSRQPAIDAEGLKQVGEELRELQAELEQARKENNPSETDRIQQEIDKLTAEVSKSLGLGGKTRDLNNIFDKLRPSIHANLKRAYKSLRNANPSLKRLAEHFESSISSESGCFVYRPARRPCWRFVPPEQK